MLSLGTSDEGQPGFDEVLYLIKSITSSTILLSSCLVFRELLFPWYRIQDPRVLCRLDQDLKRLLIALTDLE